MADRPPWHVVSSRELAKFLGVSLQSLCNWRVREVGPDPEPFTNYRGNRCHYRVDKVITWLFEQEGRAPISHSALWRAYLANIFPDMADAPETDVVDLIERLESGDVFRRVWFARGQGAVPAVS